MSTTETAIIPAYRTADVPTRRSIFPEGTCPAPTATLPAVPAATIPPAAGADWRGQALTEELPAVAARRGRGSRRLAIVRHLRAALTGTLLAIVAISGLSAYAAQGITEARQAALCQAHVTCR